MTLNMGPQHPSTHGVLRVVLELDGETILSAVPKLDICIPALRSSARSRSISRWCHSPTASIIFRTSPTILLRPGGGAFAGLEIPPKAQWMRVMMCELSRINSHLVWLGTHALDIGAMTVYFYCFREREEILRIFEMFSGQRMMTSYIRIGGLALEPPRGWEKVVSQAIEQPPRGIDEYENLLSANPIWMQSNQRRRRHFRWMRCSIWALLGR